MKQLELFYLKVPHYNLVGDFYHKFVQRDNDGKEGYICYHSNETGHSLSDSTLEKMLKENENKKQELR